MRESLRTRLVLWYALVLAIVVVLYGGAVVYQSWRSMIAGVDAELVAYAREVSNALKPVGRGRFDLELPPDAAAYFFSREGGRPYYVIRDGAGKLVDQSDPDLQVERSGAVAARRREKTVSSANGVACSTSLPSSTRSSISTIPELKTPAYSESSSGVRS